MSYNILELNLSVFLAGHIVNMVTYRATIDNSIIDCYILCDDWADFDTKSSCNDYQNLRFGKCLKLFHATLRSLIVSS